MRRNNVQYPRDKFWSFDTFSKKWGRKTGAQRQAQIARREKNRMAKRSRRVNRLRKG